jgi:hypothetical protein
MIFEIDIFVLYDDIVQLNKPEHSTEEITGKISSKARQLRRLILKCQIKSPNYGDHRMLRRFCSIIFS